MDTEEKQEIDMLLEDIEKLGNISTITCDWVDGRGGFVVTVTFDSGTQCQAVHVNRIQAHRDAYLAAKVKKASMA